MAPRGSSPVRIVGTLEADTVNSCFSNTLSDEESMGFPRPFLFGADHALLSAGPAIAMAQLEPLELLQQGDRGARPVADDEWCVAMSSGSSRVFRWQALCRWRAQWDSEWPG